MKKTLLILSAFLFLGSSIPHAQAGILEFFFPSLKKVGPNPSKTLEAPFADKEQIAKSENKNENVSNTIPLDLPHRSPEQIQDWIVKNISNNLNFTSGKNFQTDLQKLRPLFTNHSWKQYNDFLTSTNIKKIMADGRYSIRSFMDEPPAFVNKGPADGAYRWLYETSLMLSYIEPGYGYQAGQKDPISQHIALKVQLGRYNNTGNEYGILIDHWAAKVVPAKTQN